MLRLLVSRKTAETIVGDIQEELALRIESGQAPRWPRAWAELQAWQYAATSLMAIVPRAGRSASYTLRDAWRSLRSTPTSTSFILLVLTIGIAAATVTFSVVDTVVLRHLPFEDDEQLVVVSQEPERLGRIAAPQEYLVWREGVEAFESLAAVRVWSDRIDAGGGPVPVASALATASLFDVLRVRPAIGRAFTDEHEMPGREHVVVLGYGLWQRLFVGDAGVVGRTVSLLQYTTAGTWARTPVVVSGVMPEGFTYPVGRKNPVELWRPYALTTEERSVGPGRSSYLHLVGRLRPGATTAQAEAQVETTIKGSPFGKANERAYADWRASVVTVYDSLVGDVRGWMLLVLSAVGLVLLVACVNVANLLLARAARRGREIAIRGALGAGRRAIVAALLTESLMLSLTAAALGLLVAVWGIDVARGALPAGIARATDIALDVRVLGAAVAAAVVTGLFFGAVPAWQASRTDLAALLRNLSGTLAGGRQWWRSVFLVAQVAFVGILMVATTLVVSSFVRIVRADLGFDRSHLISVEQMGRFSGTTEDVVETLRAIPGVRSVALVTRGPVPLVTNASASISVRAPGVPDSGPSTTAEYRVVSGDYFATAGISFVRGRTFDRSADAGTAPIVVDEMLARELAGDGDPLGLIIQTGNVGSLPTTIIGVVRHVRLGGPEAGSGPQIYMTSADWRGARFLVRTAIDPAAVTPVIRDRLAPMRADGTPPSVTTLEDAFGVITAGRRFNATLMSIFGAIALFIGAAGVYGVMASTVAERTREIGVRVALGATTGRVTREVLGQTGRYLVVGLAIGLPAAMAISRLFTALFYEVRPTDAFVYVIVTAILLGVGLIAAFLPARRAARVDPIKALRAE
ncbi:MAG TPA: ABC transporter permease [Vicinamibacterales bacterium]|nr:ABC transporter permease [Vicinamibacterales bacterium]